MNYCSNCGIEINTKSKYCNECGHQLARSKSSSNKAKRSKSSENISYFETYRGTIRKYVEFDGRASRKEYWTFFIGNFLIGFFLGIIEVVLEMPGSLTNIVSLIVLLPGISVSARRFHDVGKSGWMVLVPIINLVLLLSRGNEADNKYGSPTTN